MERLTSKKSGPLKGVSRIPGDKSISHRALLLSSQLIGTCRIRGLLEGEDVIATKTALEQLGVTIRRHAGEWEVQGVGIGGLQESDGVLDLGNSGTAAALTK